MVRKYEKKGVLHPETTGWLAWKQAAASLNEQDAGIADQMIDITYNKE